MVKVMLGSDSQCIPPESARLLNGSPDHWVWTMDSEDAVAAALQHDAGVMTSNLLVMDRFVTSFQKTVF